MESRSFENVPLAAAVAAGALLLSGCPSYEEQAYGFNDVLFVDQQGINVAVCPETHRPVTAVSDGHFFTGCMDVSSLSPDESENMPIEPRLLCRNTLGRIQLVMSKTPEGYSFPEWQCLPLNGDQTEN